MTAVNQKSLDEMKAELQKAIDEQIQEREFKQTLIDALDQSCEVLHLEGRAATLTSIIGVLSMEELPIDEEIIKRSEDFEDEAASLRATFHEKIDAALEDMTQWHALKFIQSYIKFQDLAVGELSQFSFMVECMTDEQKAKFYDIVHSEEIKQSGDRDNVVLFVNRAGYSLDFAKEKNFFEVSEAQMSKVKPFIDFLSKYLKTYNGYAKSRVKWFESLYEMDLAGKDKLVAKYADAAVRGSLITDGSDQELYKAAVQDMIAVINSIYAQKQS
jgi:hypothetical protein